MHIKIKNKLESMTAINNLHLNQFPVALFKKDQTKKLLNSVKKYPAKYYAIFDNPVGTNNENIIIYKLRTEY